MTLLPGGFRSQGQRPDGSNKSNLVAGSDDEATVAWAEAEPDEGSAGEEVTVYSGGGGGGDGKGGSSKEPSRGWKRVAGASTRPLFLTST